MHSPAVATVLLSAVAVAAAQGPTSSPKAETAHLIITTSVGSVTANRATLVVNVVPKPTMHVYSPEQKDVIPISLKLDAGEFKAHPATLPKAEKYFFQPLNETQLVYSKPFRILQNVTLTPAASKRPGGTAITGTVRYQACDDSICYLPVTVRVAWTLGTPSQP